MRPGNNVLSVTFKDEIFVFSLQSLTHSSIGVILNAGDFLTNSVCCCELMKFVMHVLNIINAQILTLNVLTETIFYL